MHHIDFGVTKWLNIGLFEGIVFGRKDHFDFGYLNPVIFYRSIEQQNGSFDNSLLGLDAKRMWQNISSFTGSFCWMNFYFQKLKRTAAGGLINLDYRQEQNILMHSILKILICRLNITGFALSLIRIVIRLRTILTIINHWHIHWGQILKS